MSTTLTTPTEDALDDYLPVHVNTLIPETVVGIELFLRDGKSESLRLYRGGRVPIELSDLKRLLENDVRMLYIRKDEHRHYQDYLKDNIASTVCDERLSVTARFSSLNEVIRDVMASAFRKGNVDETVEATEQLATHCADLLSRDDFATGELMGVMHHDYHTFTHSANVAYFCVMLAKGLGIDDADDIRRITVGALLHDLGKLDIPDRILTKPGKLDEDEFDVVRKHPTWGFRKLCHRDDIDHAQLMMVYQHHEKVAGGGYPVGCPGSDIHDWARLCSVVDVFEALTANRPYRRPMARSQAIEIMQRDSGIAFDSEMLKCWLTIIKTS